MRVKKGRFHEKLIELLWKKNTPSTSIILPSRSCQPRRTRRVNGSTSSTGGLRRNNLRQRRASRTSSSHLWDAREDFPTGSGHLRDAASCPHRFTSPLPISPIHFLPHSPVYLCEVRERRKHCFSFLHSLLLFYFQVLFVLLFVSE